MDHGNVLLRFQDVVFHYDHRKPILSEASFSVRENAKITIVGQNGAGKSTIFKLILGELKPQEGEIHIKKGSTIGIAKQVMAPAELDLTVREFFARAFKEKKYDLDRDIKRVLEVVNFPVSFDKVLRELSGGQKARLLLAYSIIQEPDILLLDEPTNNLDKAGIEHLTNFLINYKKTCIVISHDAGFLNAFTHGVLNLDAFTQKVEQYVGDYFDVLLQIEARVEAEKRQNARMLKSIQDRKDKINFFSNKGGKMRKLASKLRDDVEEAEENMVEVRQEEKAISPFRIQALEYSGAVLRISSVTILKDGKRETKPVEAVVGRGERLRITGPNGIGKTTLLESMVNGKEKGAVIQPGVKVGYYRQDFSGLPLDQTIFQILASAMDLPTDQKVYSTAAQFLLPPDKVNVPVKALSEGQKGLLCFARFTLQKPNLLILDEPTNHINFRHLPVIAEALNKYEGGLVIISHDQDFIEKLEINEEHQIDLGAL